MSGADLHLGMAEQQAQDLSPGVPAGSGDGDTCLGHVHDYTVDCMSPESGGRLSDAGGVTMGAGQEVDVAGSWSDGNAYEHFMGRWSRQVAPRFVRWLHAPAGTALGRRRLRHRRADRTVLELASPDAVLALDPSTGFVEEARPPGRRPACRVRRGHGRGRAGRMSRTSSVSGLMLNFVPDPAAAARLRWRGGAGRHGGGVRLGLRRPDAVPAHVLGRRLRTGRHRDRPRRGRSAFALCEPHGAGRPLAAGGLGERPDGEHRGHHRVQRLRGPVGAFPGRDRRRAGVRRDAGPRGAGTAARGARADRARRPRRPDPDARPGMGGAADGSAEDGQTRCWAPCRWTASSTAASRAAAVSFSVRVRSGARKRSAKASDLRPSPTCGPV